jgi:diketogulonate reductase-like aldo/keto reductase
MSTTVPLVTKIWISDYGYDETLHGFEKSARKLGVDQIDLLILHQALPSAFERTLDAYRTLETLLGDGRSARSASATSWSTTSPPQVMLRWGIQHGRSVIPKSTKRHRIAENIDVFDFELAPDDTAAIDALDTGCRGGPEPGEITLEAFGREITEA